MYRHLFYFIYLVITSFTFDATISGEIKNCHMAYSPKQLEEVLFAVRSHTLTQRQASAWINDTAYSAWFDHFVKSVQPKHRQPPTFLIMDGYTSHTNNTELLQKPKENNVEILLLPSPCMHKLQPLDTALFKSLNTFNNKEID